MILKGKLDILVPEERAAVLDGIIQNSDDGIYNYEKLRRFASLYRHKLKAIAKKRFRREAKCQTLWIAEALLEGSSISAEKGLAPWDVPGLSAALYCLDAFSDKRLADIAQNALDDMREWYKNGAPQANGIECLGQDFLYSQGLWSIEAASCGSVALLCPNPYSQFTVSVFQILRRLDIRIDAVVIRKFTATRALSEMARDGLAPFLKRVYQKLVLRGTDNSAATHSSISKLCEFLAPESADVRILCEKNGVDVIFANEFTDVVPQLRMKSADIAIFTGGGLIKRDVIEAFKDGVLNTHGGGLPQYKGMDVMEGPILEGRYRNVGLTCHFMAPGIDEGPILSKFLTSISAFPSFATFQNSISTIMPLIAVDSVLGYYSGRLQKLEQPDVGRQYYFLNPALHELLDASFNFAHDVKAKNWIDAQFDEFVDDDWTN